MSKLKYLADLNVLIALTDENHVHFAKAMQWLDGTGYCDWGVCALTGSGLLRLLTNPKVGSLSIEVASEVLASLIDHPGYRFWPIASGWTTLVAPFADRVFGHQQVTDAYLLGLAVKENGVLVTLDKAIRYMAWPKYTKHFVLK